MAKNKQRGRLYEDEDDIDKAIKEFQTSDSEGSQETVQGSEPNTVGTNGSVDNAEDALETQKEIEEAEETAEEIEYMKCSCCGMPWTSKNKKLGRPPCSCPIFKACSGCNKCMKHCICTAKRQEEAA